MRFRNGIVKLVFAAAVLTSPIVVHAQANSAITGVVTDASGAVVPDTLVTLSNKSTGVSYTQTTDSNGSYRFPIVAPNKGYSISFSHAGFSTTTVSDVALQVSATRTQNAKLFPGANQEVEVKGGNTEVTLNTTDASIGNNFDVKLVNDLPIQDRGTGISALFSLQPGVTAAGSVTGARSDQNSVTLDGMDVNDIAAGQGSMVPSRLRVERRSTPFRNFVEQWPVCQLRPAQVAAASFNSLPKTEPTSFMAT